METHILPYVKQTSSGNLLYDSGNLNRDSVGWGGRFRREGAYVFLGLIHVDVWQKPTQYCKEITLQLKLNFLKGELIITHPIVAVTV